MDRREPPFRNQYIKLDWGWDESLIDPVLVQEAYQAASAAPAMGSQVQEYELEGVDGERYVIPQNALLPSVRGTADGAKVGQHMGGEEHSNPVNHAIGPNANQWNALNGYQGAPQISQTFHQNFHTGSMFNHHSPNPNVNQALHPGAQTSGAFQNVHQNAGESMNPGDFHNVNHNGVPANYNQHASEIMNPGNAQNIDYSDSLQNVYHGSYMQNVDQDANWSISSGTPQSMNYAAPTLARHRSTATRSLTGRGTHHCPHAHCHFHTRSWKQLSAHASEAHPGMSDRQRETCKAPSERLITCPACGKEYRGFQGTRFHYFNEHKDRDGAELERHFETL